MGVFKVKLDENKRIIVEIDLGDKEASLDFLTDLEGREDSLKHFIAEASTDSKLQISLELAKHMGFIDTEIYSDIELREIDRRTAIAGIVQKAGRNLYMSHTHMTGQLDGATNRARDIDRFVAISSYDGGRRQGESITANHFLMLEIDDPELFEAASFDADCIIGYAQKHIKTARMALRFILRLKEPPVPFVCSFSGKKSIHMLWKWDRALTREELSTLSEVWRHRCDKVRRFTKEREADEISAAVLKIDHQVVFSPIVLFRIACDHIEPGRLRQRTYRTGSPGVLSASKAIAMASEIKGDIDRAEMLAKIERTNNQYYTKKTIDKQKELEEYVIVKALEGVKPRNGGGFLCKCPVPTHKDKHASAFVSPTGFVFCSFCCVGESWVARVTPEGSIVFNGGL